jgi:hypothetical protein
LSLWKTYRRTFVSFNCSGGGTKTSFSSNDLSSPYFDFQSYGRYWWLSMSKSKSQSSSLSFSICLVRTTSAYLSSLWNIYRRTFVFFNKGMLGIDDLIHVKIPNPIIIAIIFNFDTFWFSLSRLIRCPSIFIDSLKCSVSHVF